MYSSNTGSCYSFFYAIQLLIFFSLNNFSSLYHLSKYFRQSQLFRFLHVLLEIRISIYCMNFIFSEEDLSPYLIKSFPKRLSLSLCHIISLNSELYFPNRFFIDKNCCLRIHQRPVFFRCPMMCFTLFFINRTHYHILSV